MKADRNRYGRKTQSRCGRATNRRSRWAALAAAALTAAALGAAPAGAATGGVSGAPAEGTASAGGDIVFSPMRPAGATWYGPGLYGNHTACGQVLRPTTIGVAHRTLPCGTTVRLAYHGHDLVTTVIDRGPYTPGNSFDLTNGARQALDFSGADRLRYAVALQYARH